MQKRTNLIEKLLFLSIIFFLFILIFANFSRSEIIINRYKLSDSELFVIENPYIILPSFGIIVTKGAFSEEPQYFGISHLWEHLFFRNNINNKNLKDTLVSNYYNATTFNDYITFYSVSNYNNLYNSLEAFIYAINNPNFTNQDFELEKQIIITELSVNKYNNLTEKLFKYYKNPTGGTISTINNISFEVMSNFTKSIDSKDLIFFIMDNKEFNDFKVFQKQYKSLPVKESTIKISLERISKDEIYKNYLEFKKFISTIELRELKMNNDLYLFYRAENPSLQEVFFLDVLSSYINELGKDSNFKLANNNVLINSTVYPQKLETIFMVLLQFDDLNSRNKNLRNSLNVEDIKKEILSLFMQISQKDFYNVYNQLYLDLVNNFSNSWQSINLFTFLMYHNNWQILNFYIRGCRN